MNITRLNKKPVIGISAGDPAGIGPEVTVKALASPSVYEMCRPVVVCDGRIIQQAIDFCGLHLKVNRITGPEEGAFETGLVDVLDMPNVDMDEFTYGQVRATTGNASFSYISKVIELAMKKKVDATVTGPINKEAIHLAGHRYAGHTEIYSDLTQTKEYAMMLAEGDFRVVHVSTHVSLLEAIHRVKKDRIVSVIRLADSALKTMGLQTPRIAVAGLNPHAGERGLFGNEEMEHIIPAIEETRKMGIRVDGPHPPDTVFPVMRGGQYDIVVCMYHDQGHIPTKLLGFKYNHESQEWEGVSGVNITLGLPIIRVSVDHGTAYDKSGKGVANPESMIQAIHYASRLGGNM